LIFKAEIKCVYCGVRTESLNIIQVNLCLQKIKVQYVDTKLVELYWPMCVRREGQVGLVTSDVVQENCDVDMV
jgi:hypothetical protein